MMAGRPSGPWPRTMSRMACPATLPAESAIDRAIPLGTDSGCRWRGGAAVLDRRFWRFGAREEVVFGGGEEVVVPT